MQIVIHLFIYLFNMFNKDTRLGTIWKQNSDFEINFNTTIGPKNKLKVESQNVVGQNQHRDTAVMMIIVRARDLIRH